MPRKKSPKRVRKSKRKSKVIKATKNKMRKSVSRGKGRYRDNALNRRLGRVGKPYGKRYVHQSGGVRYGALPQSRKWGIGAHRRMPELLEQAARYGPMMAQIAQNSNNPKARKALQAYQMYQSAQQSGILPGPGQIQQLPPNNQYGSLPRSRQHQQLPAERQYGSLPHHGQIQQLPPQRRPLPPRPY